MRALATFLLLIFCVVTLTTPSAFAARISLVPASAKTATHCQTDIDHSDWHLADPANSTKSADPAEPVAGDCADCSSCQICSCQCQPLLVAFNASQAASHSGSMPEPAVAGRVGITAAPELKPPRK
jgi:hypothetical protein